MYRIKAKSMSRVDWLVDSSIVKEVASSGITIGAIDSEWFAREERLDRGLTFNGASL